VPVLLLVQENRKSRKIKVPGEKELLFISMVLRVKKLIRFFSRARTTEEL
jgi:hypothetical protein